MVQDPQSLAPFFRQFALDNNKKTPSGGLDIGNFWSSSA